MKRKLNFQLNLNDLGFPKFKDLLLSMPDQIKIELKGQNHPFASLVNQNDKKCSQSSDIKHSKSIKQYEYKPNSN